MLFDPRLEQIFIKRISGRGILKRALRSKYRDRIHGLCKSLQITSTQAVYHMFVDARVPLCPSCGKVPRISSVDAGYNIYCCAKCGKTPEALQRRVHNTKATFLKLYGVDHPLKTSKFQSKFRRTMMKRYGVEYPLQSPTIMAEMVSSNVRKHGYEFPAQSADVRAKCIQTCRLIYGADNPMQSDTVRAKVLRTVRKRYGVDNPMQNKRVQNKLIATNQERYGTDFMYGSPYFKREALRTLRRNYGVDAPMRSPEIRAKSWVTCIRKYGVRHHMQDDSCFQRNNEAGFHRKILAIGGRTFNCQGFEPFLLQRLARSHDVANIRVGASCARVWYTYQGKKHRYYPDAQVGDIIYEAKSAYSFGIDNIKLFKILQAKARACRRCGYQFKCVIFDKNGSVLLECGVRRTQKFYRELIRARESPHLGEVRRPLYKRFV